MSSEKRKKEALDNSFEDKVNEVTLRFNQDREKGGKLQHVKRRKWHTKGREKPAKQKNDHTDEESLKDAKREENLKTKQEIYDQIKAGKVPDGYNEEDVLLMADYHNGSEGLSSDQSDEDDMMEVIDEFGRTRMVSRKQNYGSDISVERPQDVIYGDIIQHEAVSTNDEPPNQPVSETSQDIHYDSKWEVRDKGMGYFQFSQDEEERRRQMENIKNMKNEVADAEVGKIAQKQRDYISERKNKILLQREKSLARGVKNE